MRISVFGIGYVGVVSCGCLAELGHDVIGVDIAAEKVEMLASGRSPIVEEMIDTWRQGGRVRTEDLLAKYPELWDHAEAAADLIYEEVCLHQEYGEPLPAEEVLRRFPQWRAQLAVLLDCQQLLEHRPGQVEVGSCCRQLPDQPRRRADPWSHERYYRPATQ